MFWLILLGFNSDIHPGVAITLSKSTGGGFYALGEIWTIIDGGGEIWTISILKRFDLTTPFPTSYSSLHFHYISSLLSPLPPFEHDDNAPQASLDCV